MFGYGKKQQQQKKMVNNDNTLLYYKVGKEGVVTNYQAWLRSWREHKITEFDVFFQEGLRELKRKTYDLEEELMGLEYEPLVTISKEFWVPTDDQLELLEDEPNDVRRGYMERSMMAEWAEAQAKINATIKATNDTIKKQRDEIIAKGNESTRKNVITKLIGQVMADMTTESRRMVMKWVRSEKKDPADPESALKADTIDEAYEKYDWLFIFEAAMVTHMHADCTVDETTILERQEKAITKLKNMKHEQGSIQVWLQKFDDAIEECETMGATVTDEMKRIYLMKNVNEKIFEQTLVLWRGVLTRKSFPAKYDTLKAYVMNEYSSQMTQPDRAKVIYSVISTHRKTEPSLTSTDKDEKTEKTKCHVCGRAGHKMKKCWYYDPKLTLEENKKAAEQKMKEKQAARKEKTKEAEGKQEPKQTPPKVGNPAEMHKGTIVQLPPKQEKTGMCLVRDALLYCEPCNMAGVRPGQVDFIYDSGTVSGVMGEREIDILRNVEEEDVLIETVTGERSISKLYGDTVFGKTRILKGRRGSVLVSQYATKKMYQVINPDEDTFILKGWDHNPDTKGRTWYFIRDEDRYDDKLLHCTVDIKTAKCFAINREQRFYDPMMVPEEQMYGKMNKLINAMHVRFSHASAGELKRILKLKLNEFQEINATDIDHWYQELGRFCSGCAEGKMKEHARIQSSKPLQSKNPGGVTVGDIMFVEGLKNVKKPLMIHVDVCTKFVTGIPLKDKSEEICTSAIMQVKAVYTRNEQDLKQLVFDREPGIVPLEDVLNENGIELKLKAAGQKVGLAEVTIRLIREKARATKAGVRMKFGYLPPNQFNMDLCMDCISVLNRIPKQNQEKTPYELFTNRKTDHKRDFRVEWGEPVVVKKPKGITSDLNVTGQWGVVVRRVMNGTGVLKVYLVQSKKYAYRLHFTRAAAPEWVLEDLKNLNPDMSIGFEEEDHVVNEDLREPNEDDQADAPKHYIDEDIDDEVQFLGNKTQERVIMHSIKSAEDAWNELAVKLEPIEEEVVEETKDINEEEDKGVQEVPAGLYVTRSGRISRPPNRLIETAYAVIRETYHDNFYEGSDDTNKEIIECAYGMKKALLFQKAMNTRPVEAMKALREEVVKAIKINIWHPVHMSDLSTEEQKLVIPQMINYLEKYKPDATFDKIKVRVLARGDKQVCTGESDGPVARIESLLMLLSIAIYNDFAIFKVDVGSAFMRTPITEDVKHKWIKLDKRVVDILLELKYDEYKDYVLPDGSIVVEMDKLSYGYVEAAHYWYETLISAYMKNGYKVSGKDKCVLTKCDGSKIAISGTTVDDCLFICTRDDKWIKEQIEMLRTAFDEITVETGEELGLIGMHISMDRAKKQVTITQPKHVERIIGTFEVVKGAPSPALGKLMADDVDSPLLKDQAEYMSKCAMLMFLSQRTYPEIRPAVIKLSTKYNKATEDDMRKAVRVAEYIYGCKDTHKLVLNPKSMRLVSAADASYAEHPDGKSHSGGVVGFESDTSCYFGFVSSKQPVVAKSAGEAELIAQNKVGDLVEWAREMLNEIGYSQKKVPMLVDSTCAMQMVKQGTGSFKRAKHIKVRYFWLKDLIDEGMLELIYVPTDELVADILTKPLTGWKFQYLLRKLLGWNIEMHYGSDINEEV